MTKPPWSKQGIGENPMFPGKHKMVPIGSIKRPPASKRLPGSSESAKQDGPYPPLVVDGDNNLVDGRHRLDHLDRIGYRGKVPVVVAKIGGDE